MQDIQVSADQNHATGLAYYTSKVGDRHENLQLAIKYYEEALKFYTADAFPEKWAAIQEDITNAYSELAQGRTTTLSPVALPAQAALSKRKRNTFRLQWSVFTLVVLVIGIPFTTVLAKNYIASNSPDCVSGTLTMDGSTALQPLLTAVALDYMTRCANATIVVGGGASKTGLADVEQGNGVLTGIDARLTKGVVTDKEVPVQIGASDIFALPTQSDLVDHQVAIGVFAMILNTTVSTIHNLSTKQIQQIYTDASLKWNAICDGNHCGPADHTIVPISRTTNSGTRFTFEKYILGGVATVAGIGLNRATSSSDAVTEVATTPDSIGYAPLYQAKQSHRVTILSIDGYSPEQMQSVESNKYKFWNIEHMYTRGQPTPLAQSFINYMYSDFAKQQARKLDLLNLTDIAQDIRASHQSEQA